MRTKIKHSIDIWMELLIVFGVAYIYEPYIDNTRNTIKVFTGRFIRKCISLSCVRLLFVAYATQVYTIHSPSNCNDTRIIDDDSRIVVVDVHTIIKYCVASLKSIRQSFSYMCSIYTQTHIMCPLLSATKCYFYWFWFFFCLLHP